MKSLINFNGVFITSDGCGRTGAYLCLDSNLELYDEDGVYDIYGYTKRMKQARKGLIESVVSKLNFS